MRRVFVAHRADHEMERLEALRTAIEASGTAASKPVKVTLGTEDHAERFAACGGWTEWCREVGCGIDFHTREPYYDVILVPFDLDVGRATAEIIQWALSAGRLVMFSPDAKRFFTVMGLLRGDAGADNFRNHAQLLVEDSEKSRAPEP